MVRLRVRSTALPTTWRGGTFTPCVHRATDPSPQGWCAFQGDHFPAASRQCSLRASTIFNCFLLSCHSSVCYYVFVYRITEWNCLVIAGSTAENARHGGGTT